MGTRALLVVGACLLSRMAVAGEDGGPPLGVANAGDLGERCAVFVEVARGAEVGGDDRLIAIASCLSYIRGFREGHQLAAVQDALREPGATPASADYGKFGFYCDATKLTDGAVAELVVRFLKANPSKRTLPAGVALGLALKKEHLCGGDAEGP